MLNQYREQHYPEEVNKHSAQSIKFVQKLCHSLLEVGFDEKIVSHLADRLKVLYESQL